MGVFSAVVSRFGFSFPLQIFQNCMLVDECLEAAVQVLY